MNHRQIESFLAAAELRSFSKAGERLFISQPAVSKQIRALEEELGTAIFLRAKHQSTELTPVGALYYRFFAQSRAAFLQVQKQAQELSRQVRGKLRIGVLSGWNVSSFLPNILHRFQEIYPGVEVELSFGDMTPLREDVRRANLDVILTFAESLQGNESLQWIPIGTVRRVLLYSENHPVARSASKPVASDFKDTPFFILSDRAIDAVQLIQRCMSPYHFCPQIRLVPTLEAAIANAHSGMGVAVVDEWSREVENRFFHSIPLNSFNQAVLAWQPESENLVIPYFLNEFSTLARLDQDAD